MSTKITGRPGLTAAMTIGRELHAAGWRYDSSTRLSRDSTERQMLHPSGAIITATTTNDGERTELTLAPLSLEQVAGAIRGARLTGTPASEAAQPDQTKRQVCRKGMHSAIPALTLTFDEGARRLHWCAEHVADAEQYRDSSDQRIEPALAIRSPLVSGRWAGATDAEQARLLNDAHVEALAEDARRSDYWVRLAAEVHRAADRLATLAGIGLTPDKVELEILGVAPQHANHASADLVDAVADAFGRKPYKMPLTSGNVLYKAEPTFGPLTIDIATYLPPNESEMTQLRRELAEARAQLAAATTPAMDTAGGVR